MEKLQKAVLSGLRTVQIAAVERDLVARMRSFFSRVLG